MSFTNQENLSTTASTGNQHKLGGQHDASNPSYNNAGRFDNTNHPIGGAQFGASGDPNNFSTAGNTNTDTGIHQQSSGQNYTSDVGSGYHPSSAVNPNGSNPNETKTNSNPNTVDASGNSVAGSGEGFGDAQGGDYQGHNSGPDAIAGSNAHGHHSKNNPGAENTHPDSLRGGANDPAYQPGSHYDYKRNQYVNDGTEGNNQGAGKVGLGAKIKGTVEQVQGKITKNPNLVQEGQARKAGTLNNDNGGSNDDSNFSPGNNKNRNNANNLDETTNTINTGTYVGQDQYTEGNTRSQHGQGNDNSI